VVFVIRPGESLYDQRWQPEQLDGALTEQDFARGQQFVDAAILLSESLKDSSDRRLFKLSHSLSQGVMVVVPSAPIRKVVRGTAFSERVVRPEESLEVGAVPIRYFELTIGSDGQPALKGTSPEYDSPYNYHMVEDYYLNPLEHRLAICVQSKEA